MTRCTLLLAIVALNSWGAEEGFVSLFNGRDLSGWINVNCAPETWSVREGVIHCTGKPTGALRIDRQYENYTLDLEWRHLSAGGNSGIFIWATPIAAPGVPFLRAIEVQVLDNGYNVRGRNEWYTTHGDVFPIHGSTMQPFGRHNGMRSFPSEERSKSSPAWNQYRIVCTNGVIRLSVNGKEVSGGENCNYRRGYIALESEGAPVEFRNIRIKEFPSSGAQSAESAPLDQGWRPLFTGLDLRGWVTNATTASRWGLLGESLLLKNGSANGEAALWSEKPFGDVEIIVDCRPGKPPGNEKRATPAIHVRGQQTPSLDLVGNGEPDKYHRFVVKLKGRVVTVSRDGTEIKQVTLPADSPAQGRFGLAAVDGSVEFMNLYVRDL